MARVKRGVTAHAKHKKVLEQAKGFFGRRKNTIRAAKAAVDKSMQYAYRDRKNRKREFRALWIQRINAAVREHGLTYSRFISGLIGGDRGRPQSVVRPRHHRAGGLRGDRREGQRPLAEGGVSRCPSPACGRGQGEGVSPAAQVPHPALRATFSRRREKGRPAPRAQPPCPIFPPSARNPRRHRRRPRRASARGGARRRARQEGLDFRAARHARQDVAGRAQERGRGDQRAEGRGRRGARRAPRRAESRGARGAAQGRGGRRDAARSPPPASRPAASIRSAR